LDSDSTSWLAVGGIVACLGLLAFSSATEGALRRVRRHRLKQTDSDNSSIELVESLLEDEPLVLEAFVLGQALALITGGALTTLFAVRHLSPLAATGLFGISLLVFPATALGVRAWASQRPESISVALIRPISLAAKALIPMVWLLQQLSAIVLRANGTESNSDLENKEEEEIYDLSRSSKKRAGSRPMRER
jgi:CBS domain containing-hemolysin-like protein